VVNGADSQLPGPPPASQFTGRAAYALSQLNGLIVVLVAGTVWWWHLREGRRTVSP
jgi:hypothetical protein